MENLDIAVVGAGPCGIAVGAAARAGELTAALFDKGCVANSILNYPYYMRFFSTADRLEVGGVPFTVPEKNPSRQEALVYYRRVVEHFGLDVRQYESVESISGEEGSFVLRTASASGRKALHRAKRVVVATGGFHAPNFLGVPGEELPKVLHHYKEPHPFFDQDVLVVGGSNSAVEASLELFRVAARVTMVHFLGGLDAGVKPWVVPDIKNRLDQGEISVYWGHRVAEIAPEAVTLRAEETGALTELRNDWVLALTGWRSDPALLKEAGVRVDPDTGVPHHDRHHHGNQRARDLHRWSPGRREQRQQDLHRERPGPRRPDRPNLAEPPLRRRIGAPRNRSSPILTPMRERGIRVGPEDRPPEDGSGNGPRIPFQGSHLGRGPPGPTQPELVPGRDSPGKVC